MPISIKNDEVERLIEEIVDMTGESKTEAIRRSLQERKVQLSYRVTPGNREGRLLRFLEQEVWPAIPGKQRGWKLSKKKQESILGYGRHGV